MLTRTVPTDHGGLEVLTYRECMALLASTPVGRFAFVDRGELVVLPVNHRIAGGGVVFRTTFGAKLDTAVLERPASFEVDHSDPDTRTGWSVIARGVAEPVVDQEEIAELDRLGLEPWVTTVDRDHWIRLRLREVTGRRIVRVELEP